MLVSCQLGSGQYTKQAVAKVVSCRPAILADATTHPAQEHKGKKGKDATPKVEEKAKEKAPQLYDIELSETIFFPEGGGQPADTGRLGSAEVTHVYRDGEGRVLHRASAPLQPDEQVELTIDWDRRFDHMQQHSSQHLLSAVCKQLYGWNTASWRLAPVDQECHVELDASDVTAEQLAAVQAAVNAHIRAHRPLQVHVFDSPEEANKHPLLREKPGQEGAAQPAWTGPLRAVEISGVELNKCCGTHLANTAEMQAIVLTKTERKRAGHICIFFVAGNRALAMMTRMLETQKQLTTLLSAGPADHPERVESLATSLRTCAKERDALQTEVAALVGQTLAAENKTVAVVHRVGGNMDALAAIANAASQRNPGLLLLATSAPVNSQAGEFLLAGPEALVSKLGPQVAQLLEGRGGGRKGRYQGKAQRVGRRDEAEKLLREQVEAPQQS